MIHPSWEQSQEQLDLYLQRKGYECLRLVGSDPPQNIEDFEDLVSAEVAEYMHVMNVLLAFKFEQTNQLFPLRYKQSNAAEYEATEVPMPWRERVGRLERHTGHLTGRHDVEFGEALIAAAAAEENVPTSSVEQVGDGSVISSTRPPSTSTLPPS